LIYKIVAKPSRTQDKRSSRNWHKTFQTLSC
jgi:hypothetical protein